jgi:hypothetical protein
VLLALPQAALPLGNAVIATAEEHNALFPDRPVTVRRLALDHALMNFGAAAVGGVPMCRGAGGMAGHIRFGARTGGALVMLGIVLCTVGLFFADSVSTRFRLFPMPILGVILFFGGLELAAGVSNEGFSHEERVVLVVTAAFALWNMGLGYLAGLIVYHVWRRGLVAGPASISSARFSASRRSDRAWSRHGIAPHPNACRAGRTGSSPPRGQ